MSAPTTTYVPLPVKVPSQLISPIIRESFFPLKLYLYVIQFPETEAKVNFVKSDSHVADIGILFYNEIDFQDIPPIQIYNDNNELRKVGFHYVREIQIVEERYDLLCKWHLFMFNFIIKRSSTFDTFQQDEYSKFYLVCPLELIVEPSLSSNELEQSDSTSNFKSLANKLSAITSEIHVYTDTTSNNISNRKYEIDWQQVETKDRPLPINGFRHAIVRTDYNDHCYIPVGFTDLTPLSPFPHPEYDNYQDYYERKWNRHESDFQMNLLEVKHFSVGARNVLQPRLGSQKTEDNKANTIMVIPSFCFYYQFSVEFILTFKQITSVLHRLEQYLILNKLRLRLQALDCTVDLTKLLEAVTTPSAHDNFSNERLEFLGISVLKLYLSEHVYTQNEQYNEEDLTITRTKLINLIDFEAIARKVLQLQNYVYSTVFQPKGYIPAGFTEETKIQKNKKNKKNIETNTEDSVEATTISSRVLGNINYAILGACYLNTPLDAKNFIQFLLNDQLYNIDNATTVTQLPNSQINSLTIRIPSIITKMESLLKYEFQYKSLLISAFVHGSVTTTVQLPSYQRLEFLGDAVLELIATEIIYRYSDSHLLHAAGDLTYNRQYLVSNSTFAAITVEFHLDQCILCSFTGLNQVIENYIKQRNNYGNNNHNNYNNTSNEAPKILGDIIESLFAAIYLDSNGDLETVYKCWKELVKWDILDNGRLIKFHPKTPRLGDKLNVINNSKSALDNLNSLDNDL